MTHWNLLLLSVIEDIECNYNNDNNHDNNNNNNNNNYNSLLNSFAIYTELTSYIYKVYTRF